MDNEVINFLLAHENMKIIQRKDMFNFSLDTVLLANFCTINKYITTIVDFGTNNAAVPLLLSRRTSVPIVGVEIQADAIEVAKKNIALNNLEKQIDIVHQDIKEYVKDSKKARLIVCNPPFFRVGENSNLNESEFLQIARHEIMITLEEIIKSAARILDYHGRFAMVHRPERMIEVISLMQKYDIEPKRIQFVYPKVGKEANVFLIEGMFKGNKGVKILPPLYAHESNGDYTEEIRRMFGEFDNE